MGRNKSTFASPVDASINKWLYDSVNRTKFMPFAPSCFYDAASCFGLYGFYTKTAALELDTFLDQRTNACR